MVGFIETSYGIKPLNLSNIQSVSYFTNSQNVTYETQGQTSSAAVISGTLVVEYIGNDVGVQSSGGNVVLAIPYYKDREYPKKRFWDWVKEINGGSVNKTFNQFLRTNRPFVVSSYITTNYSSKVAYVVPVDENSSLESICETVFDTVATEVEGLPGEKGASSVLSNTYINVGLQIVGSSQASESTFPHIGRRVFISEVQGYMSINVFGQNEEKGANFDQGDSPALTDGTYAWLSGTPGHTRIDLQSGQANPVSQVGQVYKVIIKGGRIVRTVACPVDFEAPNAVKDIPGKIQLEGNANNNANCACYAGTYGNDQIIEDDDYNRIGCSFPGACGFKNRPWSPAMFAFTNIPEAEYETIVNTEEMPPFNVTTNMDVLVCPGGDAMDAFSQAMANIPTGATAWIKDSNDEYVPFGSSNASVRFMQQPDCGNQGDLQEIIVPMSALYPEFVIDSTMVPPTGTEDQIIPAFEITTTKPNSFGDPISITCGFFKKEFKQLDSRFPKATAISMMSSQARQVTGGAVTMSDGCFGGAAGA
tara:strand:- start:797 stop:2395 length:1599 start_codon:yes stop_codon:yes gene_type:complete